MKDNYFSFEVKDWLGVRVFVYQDHAFAEEVALDDLFLVHGFDAEAVGLTCRCLFDIDSLAVNGLYLHLRETSNLGWAELADLAWSNCA